MRTLLLLTCLFSVLTVFGQGRSIKLTSDGLYMGKLPLDNTMTLASWESLTDTEASRPLKESVRATDGSTEYYFDDEGISFSVNNADDRIWKMTFYFSTNGGESSARSIYPGLLMIDDLVIDATTSADQIRGIFSDAIFYSSRSGTYCTAYGMKIKMKEAAESASNAGSLQRLSFQFLSAE